MKAKKINFKSLVLKSGSHSDPNQGMCIMEAVAYFAKEPHSDTPECACPVLTAYMIKLNDSMNNKERQMLKPYIKKLIGTKDGNSQKRMTILAKHALTIITPYSLELAGLKEHAKIMKNLKIEDNSAAWSAARSAASAAESAARSAARSAASAASAAWSAARSAASAAESAAWSAAESAEKERENYWKMALNALDEALKVK